MHKAAVARFEKQFGHQPQAIYFSPGRVNLIGEHTDYNGGWVLPVAIQLGNYFLVAPNQTQSLRIFSSHFSEEVVIDLAAVKGRQPGQHWQDYFVGVLKAFIDRPGALPGLDVFVDSTLPTGGGLSSSASVTTGFATLLNDVWVLGLAREQLALVAQSAENDYVGLACGVLDPFAIAMGRSGCALALNCATMEWAHVPFPSDDYSIVAVNTGVRRALATSDYNRRRSECERALGFLQQSVRIKSLSEASLDDLDASQALQQDPVALRRARHVLTENARVKDAVAALKEEDMPAFGRLLVASHRSLRDDYEVSCRELDIMVEEAIRLPGVVGAKMTGAGFGGCIVAVVGKGSVEEFVAELSGHYKKRCDIMADFHVCEPASGAARVADL